MSSNIVSIIYTRLPNPQIPFEENLLREFPQVIADEILLYKKNDDRWRQWAGKKLLLKQLQKNGYSPEKLSDYRFDQNKKPYICDVKPFNITHSGNIIACVMASDAPVGIDVEMMRSIDIPNFTRQFSPREMSAIQGANDPLAKFFDYWTRKESVMKADGRGMQIPLHSIHLGASFATIDGSDLRWYYVSLFVGEGYKAHVCSPVPMEIAELNEVSVF